MVSKPTTTSNTSPRKSSNTANSPKPPPPLKKKAPGLSAGTSHALEPGKTYHYRLTATNGAAGNPVVHGNEQILKSPIPGKTESGEEENQPNPCPNEVDRYGASARLPDCRAYEQITPANKEGAQDNWAYGATETNTTPGLDGEHVAISTLSRFGKNDNSRADTVYLFSRTPKWLADDLHGAATRERRQRGRARASAEKMILHPRSFELSPQLKDSETSYGQ